ncbi:MAG: hypothetical protein LC646_11250 [Xanthomonadaceae bacterium]|nr:hypothetical protein [Xanthomonadaceae bacterium]
MAEIVCAYQDAAEAIPFGPAVGAELTEKELFHLAPLVCLKRRGIKRTRKNEKVATEAALSTYVANEEVHGSSLSNSIMAFSLCYVASHYALSLLDETESESILNFVEAHLDEVQRQIETYKPIQPT